MKCRNSLLLRGVLALLLLLQSFSMPLMGGGMTESALHPADLHPQPRHTLIDPTPTLQAMPAEGMPQLHAAETDGGCHGSDDTCSMACCFGAPLMGSPTLPEAGPLSASTPLRPLLASALLPIETKPPRHLPG